MVARDAYVATVRQRLVADGCAVTDERLGAAPVVVGYRSQVRLLARIHVFTVVAKMDRVQERDLRTFVDDVVRLGLDRKGQWRGVQSGVLVLPVLVTEAADPAATALTRQAYRLNLAGFGVMAQPAVVDVRAGRVWTFRGTRIWGYAYNSLIKKKYQTYLPEPSAEAS
ncbi:hypothetical protein [Salinispora sp. H7-4]|uniref:hypothetical protein n=1 Tax=Salinispora sp. H7-4 TaxID=2748321 RepID=UPI0015D16296|nr:hypothetical protein [Salinispora sp. H7-4]NYT93922.1 hypothetical protein [Salinispora sp. H7-4]